ncbi:MAG: S-layer homology domain-containing protein [Paenibacillus dendritiformis]|uniref:S-layer homology domain-containing protein n=1 Tax=uncultured Paenibacillus sp. TaxID=227322 RepID=UPI0025EC9309|nr:S-layer homology domain-containing protein [uncultured Paenibacillus sp.]MDU5141516.1 S-layer homology domain-containing protein [Paenibacillus dendritiformis]
MRAWLKPLYMLLVIALVSMSIPLDIVKAADQDGARYFHFDNLSTVKEHPTQVNTETIEVKGTFNGVSSSSIGYRVDLEVNGKIEHTTYGTDVKPIITGNSFIFRAVPLKTGLNIVTVTGLGPNGNTVEASAYVEFSNAPAISDIKLSDGRILESGVPLIVRGDTASLSLKAPNASTVTVNGRQMFNGGAGMFVSSGIALQPGLNELVIVATNGNLTYTITRHVISFNGVLTGYDTFIGASAIDATANHYVSAPVSGTVKGKFIVPKSQQNNTPAPPTVEVVITKESDGTEIFNETGITNVTKKEEGSTYIIYEYETTGTASPSSTGKYKLNLKVAYDGKTNVFYNHFTVRDANAAEILGVKQLFNPQESGSTVSFGAEATFAQNSTVFELPLYLKLDVNNFTGQPVSITDWQNGKQVGSTEFQSNPSLTTVNGEPVIRIDAMPAGDQTLKIEVGGETYEIKVSYSPGPYIKLTNVHDGKTFDLADGLPDIQGQLINFNLNNNDELDKLTITFNGKKEKLTRPNSTDGTFTHSLNSQLVPGPNKITFDGVANGVPISYTITVFFFSKDVPAIVKMYPVPAAQDPTNPNKEDTEQKFKLIKDYEYVTKERSADVWIEIQNATSMNVYIDGKLITTLDEKELINGSPNTNPAILFKEQNTTTGSHLFLLHSLEFPTSGKKNVTVEVRKGVTTARQTLEITREQNTFEILSPKLPDESVVNQNFLMVSIRAEGADKVLIGKQELVKGEQDIFRGEITLKKGKNKIKFTVMQGKQKINGTFEVNYADAALPGAQYKTTIGKNGKLSAFGGNLLVQLPKGTMLRDMNPRPGQTPKEIQLFDKQNLLFGIADPDDGRTITRENQVGVRKPVTGGSDEFLDGQLRRIDPDEFARSVLMPKAHFGLGSSLYWIDAGYFSSEDSVLNQDYKLVSPSHPYDEAKKFYERGDRMWLEPTQRGTITIKYDPNIVNEHARNVGVWRWNNTNKSWENLGGKLDTKKKTITAPFDGFGYYGVFAVRYSYDDIISHKYARKSLELMMSRGFMKAKNLNEFGVYDNITRGEMATMLVKMLNIPLDYDPDNLTFDDVVNYEVPDLLWDYRYIETAARKGIVRGLAPRLFMPNGELTRQEAAVMISRALNLKIGDPDKDLAKLQKTFTDANIIDHYSISPILAVTKAGIINGIPNQTQEGQKKPTYRFDPKSNLTRADAAVMGERILGKVK